MRFAAVAGLTRVLEYETDSRLAAVRVCHGAIVNRDALRQSKDEFMASCVNCHKLRRAPLCCGLGHTVGY